MGVLWQKGDGSRLLIVATVVAVAVVASISFGRLSQTESQRRPATPPGSPAVAQGTADDDIYTGSILLTPTSGDDCWQRFLDNLTGRIWDHGKVSCDAAALRSAGDRPASSPRLEAIAKSFRGQ